MVASITCPSALVSRQRSSTGKDTIFILLDTAKRCWSGEDTWHAAANFCEINYRLSAGTRSILTLAPEFSCPTLLPPLCPFGSSTCAAWGNDRKWDTLHLPWIREDLAGLRNRASRVSHSRRATLRDLRLACRWKRKRPHLLSQSPLRDSRTQYKSLMATCCHPREEQRRARLQALTGRSQSPIPWRRQHHRHRHHQGRSLRHRR